MRKALFCCDLLRVDEQRRIGKFNPQIKNLRWLYALLGLSLEDCYSIDSFDFLTGDEDGFHGVKGQVYSKLRLPISVKSWAYVYEGVNGRGVIDEELDRIFLGYEYVFGFELPPYLIDYLNLRGIKYIDFTIHPIRFLPDYLLGVRSNIEEVRGCLSSVRVQDELIRSFANVSKARSERVLPVDKFIPDSAIFMGQTEVDSSLIKSGRMYDLEDVEDALLELSMLYPHVYYKFHPYCKNKNEIESVIGRIKNCSKIDINIYDSFSGSVFSLVAALSSGSLVEAGYFGCKVKYFIGERECFSFNNPRAEEVYYPIYKDIFRGEFWRWVSGKSREFNPSVIDPYEGAVKFSLDMKWGR